MIVKEHEATSRFSNNIEIKNYLTKAMSDSFSFAVATLDGVHDKTISSVSDRAYYIIEGMGDVFLDSITTQVMPGDFVYIPKNTVHSISGNLKYVIINSPPFDSNNERKI